MLRVMMLGGILAFGAAGLVGCETTPRADGNGQDVDGADQAAITDASRAVLFVEGMSCPMCATNVDLKLRELAGVEKVDVNMGLGSVEVAFTEGAERPTRAQLAAAVRDSGFTLKRIETE